MNDCWIAPFLCWMKGRKKWTELRERSVILNSFHTEPVRGLLHSSPPVCRDLAWLFSCLGLILAVSAGAILRSIQGGQSTP